jgi:hypothetical protein
MRAITTRILGSPLTSYGWYLLPFLGMLVAQVALSSHLSIGLNPDLIAYLSIARQYAEGNFDTALNAYWSPLLSWLLAPFLLLSIDPLLSFRILMLFCSVVLFHGCASLLASWGLNATEKLIGMTTVAALNVYFGLSAQTPDYLSATCLIWFLHALIHRNLRTGSLSAAMLCCYAAKSMLLPLGFALLVLQVLKSYKNVSLRIYFLKEGSILLLFLGLWMSLLYTKYHKITLSTAYAYNSTVFGPEGDLPHYTSYASLLEPPAGGLSAWDDPGNFPIAPSYPWLSIDHLNRFLATIKVNLNMWPYFLRYHSYFGLSLLLIPALMVWLYYKKIPLLNGTLLLLIATALIWLGYTLIFIKERYLIPAHYPLLLACLSILFSLSQSMHARWKFVLWLWVAISFIKMPVQELRRCWLNNANEKQQVAMAYEIAGKKIIYGQRIATFTSESGLYNYMLLACFLSQATFVGELNHQKNPEKQVAELKKFKVQSFFFNHCASLDTAGVCTDTLPPSWLKKQPILFRNQALKTSIYRLSQ